MVKVISAYNFQQQDTYSTSGDIIAACLTASDRVAIAHRNHLIEILTLERRCCDTSASPLSSSSSTTSSSQASFDKNENRPPLRSAIPTVDHILRLYYCAKGNFLITLEQKSEASDAASNSFVRVYTNFDIVDSENCFNIPIRARIASKVTPKSSSTECIEVIELPICGGTPNLVACCQNSGTIAICCGSKLIFYEFRQCTNEAQKFAFIDFFEFPFHIRLDFAPLEIKIAEHVVACVDQSTLIVFKVVDLNEEDTEDGSTSNNSLATDSSVNVCNERTNPSLDFDVAKRCNHVNGIEFQANILSNWDNDNDKRTSFSEERPVVVNDAKIMLRYTENNQVANDRLFYSVRSLLQLRLVQKRNTRQIHDEFRTITLKPIYYKSDEREVVDRCPYSHLMKSDDHGNCVGYSFFISTVSDGYLYQFTNQGKWYTENMKCLATYPFTAPVIDVVIDNFVIHAVTESGIETFSSRIGHKLFSSYFEYPMMSDPYPHETSPLVDVPICVMGICGFFGVRYVISSEEKLVLLSTDKERRTTIMKNQKKSQEKFEPDWTIYDLLLPRPEILVSDIKSLANIYRNTSPDIYYELLEEAHIIIRLARELKFQKYDSMRNNLEKTYSDTCQLLADFTIQSDRKDIYSQAVAYYSMCKQPIWNIYVQYWSNRSSTTNTCAGLVYTLKILLSNIGSSKSDAEQLTHPVQPIVNKNNKGHLSEHLIAEEFVDLFKEYAPKEIASICLASSAIREILNDQLIEWFNRKDLNNEEKLCLILCLCRGNQLDKAINILENISRKDIYQTIKDNWIILFDNFQPDNYRRSSFSDLTENVLFVTDRIPIIEAISDVFIYLLSVAHLIDLDFILKLFMNYFAVYLGHKGYRTSQKILEIILQAYFYDLYNSRHRNNAGGKISDTSLPNSEIMLTQSQSSLGHDIGGGNETIRGLSGGGASITFPNIINQTSSSSTLLIQNATGLLKSTIIEDSPTSSSTTVDSNYEDPEFEALKILFRMYLGLLNQYSGEFDLSKANDSSTDCDCNALPDVMGYRLAFLDYMYRCSKTIKAVHSKLDRKVALYRFEYVNTLPLYNDCDLNDLNMEENIFRRPIVFFEKREKYLNSMPPFDENSFKVDTDDVLYFNDWDKEVNVVLIKIQALLNSGKLDSSIIDDFITFIHSNPNVIGIDSLMTILLPKPEGVEFLIHVNPTCLLPYAKSRLTTGNQWQILFNRILKKKRELPDNNLYSIRLYDKIIEDILKDLVNEKPLEEFLACMPEYEINHTTGGDDDDGSGPYKQDETQQQQQQQQRKHSPDGIDETNPFQLIIRDAVAKQRSDALCAMIHSTGRQLFDAVYNYQLHLN